MLLTIIAANTNEIKNLTNLKVYHITRLMFNMCAKFGNSCIKIFAFNNTVRIQILCNNSVSTRLKRIALLSTL